jgi:xanthine dehydrogenase molybdopterin-binding subunit B
MNHITQWSEEEQIDNWKKIKEITAYNKKHFFSDVFFNLIVEELKCNLEQGLAEVEETNTSKKFLLLRKKFFTPLKFSVYFQQQRSANKTAIIHILLKARSYYNRYLKSVK